MASNEYCALSQRSSTNTYQCTVHYLSKSCFTCSQTHLSHPSYPLLGSLSLHMCKDPAVSCRTNNWHLHFLTHSFPLLLRPIPHTGRQEDNTPSWGGIVPCGVALSNYQHILERPIVGNREFRWAIERYMTYRYGWERNESCKYELAHKIRLNSGPCMIP